MREAELKRRRHAKVLNDCPMCIYCGGVKQATTVDHMPPIGMFQGRRRPKGLEFASCESCNHGTKTADLVAALVGRFYPDAVSDEQKDEMKRLLKAIGNNVPGLLEEMFIGTAGQEIERRRTPGIRTGVGFMRAGGPLVSKFMQMFAVKFGFALHYHTTSKMVPSEGGVAARWFSNVDRLTDRFPQSIFRLLPPASTLQQGKVGVPDQFEYSATYSEDGSIGLYLGTFRQAFAVVAFAATQKTLLADAVPEAEGFRILRAWGDLDSVGHGRSDGRRQSGRSMRVSPPSEGLIS